MKPFLLSIFSCSAFILLLASCERKELPVPLYQPDPTTRTDSVDMNIDYRYQIFYSLDDNRIVSKNLKTDWDLGFESSSTGINIILNGSKAMFAMPVPKPNLELVHMTDTAGFGANKRWDAPSGNHDSTAFSGWINSTNSSYVIDRGYAVDGTRLGFYRMRILSVDESQYQILVSKMENDTVIQTVSIPKNPACNYTYFSFDGNKVVTIEPPMVDWDLQFTVYTHTFYDPSYMSYSVTGCLINPYNTEAARTASADFDVIDKTILNTTALTKARNAIGYDWKDYNFDLGKYAADPRKNYVVRTQSGKLYKLHFIDFSNAAGIKGNPKFEYKEL